MFINYYTCGLKMPKGIQATIDQSRSTQRYRHRVSAQKSAASQSWQILAEPNMGFSTYSREVYQTRPVHCLFAVFAPK